MTLPAVDLFCGCGGLSLGAHLAGFRTSVAVDIDRDLSSAFSRNFPESRLAGADLSKLAPSDLDRHFQVGRPTAVIGGPPCQGFSVMGRRNSKDPRNKLLQSFFAFVAYFRPSFFMMENVPGLLEETNRYQLDEAMEFLPGRYRCLEPTILDAALYGAATHRPRLVLVGYDPEYVDEVSTADLLAIQTPTLIDVRAVLSDLPIIRQGVDNNEWLPYRRLKNVGAYASELRKPPPVGLGDKASEALREKGLVSGCQITRHSRSVAKRFAKLEAGERDRISKYPRLDWKRPAQVLRAGTGVDKGSFQAARPIHPIDPRVITVREAARIQGFPDWFQFHPTKWHSHRMIGNSVSPPFAQLLLGLMASKLSTVRKDLAAE